MRRIGIPDQATESAWEYPDGGGTIAGPPVGMTPGSETDSCAGDRGDAGHIQGGWDA